MQMQSEQPPSNKKPLKKVPSKGNSVNAAIKYTGMATKMMVVILVGVWGGRKIDSWANTDTPWFTLILSLISVGAAIYIVIRDTKN